MFDIDQLRADVASGKRPLRITTHAQVEAFKDGLMLANLKHTFEHGEVIEIYPDDDRGLLFANPPEINIPVHIVVEDAPDEGVIVTAYIQIKVSGLPTNIGVKAAEKSDEMFSLF